MITMFSILHSASVN